MTDLQNTDFLTHCSALHLPRLNQLNVDMRSNKTDDTIHPSYCEFKSNMVNDISISSIESQCNLCLDASCNETGNQYGLPIFNCSFNFSYSETSQPNSYERYGYEKLPRFLDLENDPIFQEFVNALNTTGIASNIVKHPTLNLSYDTTIHNVKLTFDIYMLLRYIERISNGEIKTIVPGIFYCNGKIYYYVSFSTQFRVIKPNSTSHYLNDPYLVRMMNKYHILANITETDASASIIHTDFPNITSNPRKYFPEGTYDTYNVSPTTLLNVDRNLEMPDASIGCQVQTSFSDIERILLSDDRLILNSYNVISFKEAFAHETDLNAGVLGQLNLQTEDFANASLMLYHLINHNKDDDNYDLFNIWLQLVGTYDDKTMGFFNSPQTNEGLEDLYKVNDDNTFSALYGNIGYNAANIEHLPDKTAYTFVMKDGDALRFTEDKIPHFGRSTEYGIRFSKEGRYLLYDIDFDLNSAFEISPDGTTLLVKKNADNVPDEIPPYLPLTIYKWFQDEFSLISQQYNRIQGRLSERILSLEYNEMITMEIFQAILDNVPFQDYKWIINPRQAFIGTPEKNNPGVEAFLTRD